MRTCFIAVVFAALAPGLAVAADYDGPVPSRRARAEAYGYRARPPGLPPGPIVVPPRATVLVIPPEGPRAGLLYAPPPVPRPPPPLIAAVPIIGEYLVPTPIGPPPATVLDAYDARFDYNQ